MNHSGQSRNSATSRPFGRGRHVLLSVLLVTALIAFFAPAAAAAGRAAGPSPVAVATGAALSNSAAKARKAEPTVSTSSDEALNKLDEPLQQKYHRHQKGSVPVFVSVSGDPSEVASQLDNAHATRTGDIAIVIGQVPTGELVKLADDA